MSSLGSRSRPSLAAPILAARALGALVVLLALAAIAPACAAEEVRTPRLYALDCGGITFDDMSAFSDTGEYDGHSGTIAVPCFLVRHPKGVLLWDTGLGDVTAAPAGRGVHMHSGAPLTKQLATIGLSPRDVTYVAFSHLHLDHTGGANAFANSLWILNRLELAWALSTPPPFAVVPDSFSAYRSARTRMIDGDYDVFGDGTVRILKAPGHTPGHQVLMLSLAKTGVVILSGDLYHLRTDREFRRMMTVNTDRAQTLASMDRIERIVHNTHARMVIQHDPQDFRSLPVFPAWLD